MPRAAGMTSCFPGFLTLQETKYQGYLLDDSQAVACHGARVQTKDVA
jgi:hypothetical protein